MPYLKKTFLIIVALFPLIIFPSPSYAESNPPADLSLSSNTGYPGTEITATVTIAGLPTSGGFVYTYRLEIGDDWGCTDPGNCGADDKYGKISVQIKDGYVLTKTFESGFAWDITTFNFTPDPLTPTTGTVTFWVNIIVDNLTGEANNEYVVRVKSSPGGTQTIWDKELITKTDQPPAPTPTPWPTPVPPPKSGPYSYTCENIDGNRFTNCHLSDNPDAFCDAQAGCSGSGVYYCDNQLPNYVACRVKPQYFPLPPADANKSCLLNPIGGGIFQSIDGVSCGTDLDCHCMASYTGYQCDQIAGNTCQRVPEESLPSSCVNFAEGLACDITSPNPHQTCRQFAGCDSYFCNKFNECELGTPNYDLTINVFVDNVGNNCAVDLGDTGIANASIIVTTSEGVQLTPKATDGTGTVIFPSLPEGGQNVYLDPASVPQYEIIAQNPTTAWLPPEPILNYCIVPKVTPTPTRTPTPPAPTSATLPPPPPPSTFSIEGYFFFDTNNNQVKDGSESNQGHSPYVHLWYPDGRVKRARVDRPTGKYMFTGIDAGSYVMDVGWTGTYTVPVPYPYPFFLAGNAAIDFGVGVPTPTNTPTPRPAATSTPRPTATSTPRPTATRTPTPRPTATSTPKPTATRTPTPRPTATITPRPTATRTPTPRPATPTPTRPPAPTNTPQPTNPATTTPTIGPGVPTPTVGGPTSGQPTVAPPTSVPTHALSVPPHCAELEYKDGGVGEDGTPTPSIVVGCKSIDSAIGNIPTSIGAFVNRLLGFLIGIGAGIAVLLIIYAGYLLMTSQGNPEQIQKAKNILTAVIAGLLFLIFSIMLLEVITVDILHIPLISY